MAGVIIRTGMRVRIKNSGLDCNNRYGTVTTPGGFQSLVRLDGETRSWSFHNTSLDWTGSYSGPLPAAPAAPAPVPAVTAPGLLTKAKDLLDERGKTYDPKGKAERSMKKIVHAFNTITGQDLTEVQGWEFMAVLKQVRFFQNESKPHADSLEDLISYSALLGEAALTTTN